MENLKKQENEIVLLMVLARANDLIINNVGNQNDLAEFLKNT